MKTLFAACGGILLAAMATPAAAQIAGIYNGNSADGSGLTFTISTDSDTGLLAVTSAGVGFSAPCKNSTLTLNEGWGYGLNADIVNHKVTAVSTGAYFDITVSLKFAANGQSATGTITTLSPTLDNTVSPAKKALFCASPKQTLTLTYAGPAAARAPAHGVILYDRKGRAIGQVQR
ncbi:MAG: hypothetical protein WDN04_06030 [Rhodospirillales bacterium]